MKHAFTAIIYDHGTYQHTYVSEVIPVPDLCVSIFDPCDSYTMQLFVFDFSADARKRREEFIKSSPFANEQYRNELLNQPAF